MRPISPICRETVSPLVGRRVCAVTRDGRRYYGTVSQVDGGRMLLTDCTIEAGAALASVPSKRKRPARKAKTSAWFGGFGYGGYGFGYGAYWLEFAAIASLFLLALFWI